MSRNPRQINADLHCHSHVSDGLLAPAQVARRAHAQGVQVWALTDHDEVGGLQEARDAARALGMRFVPGVEISVTWAGETIHVVGLDIDFRDAALLAGLAKTRGGREQRARDMAECLAEVGIPGAFDGALKFVGNPDLISRTHFARFIVDAGYCKDVTEVFANYLADGKPGFVPHRWAKLSDAVSWIRQAGGVAVIAHPGRYALDDPAMWSLLSEFRDAGGAALEVVSGSHAPEHLSIFAAHARQFGFKASRGSDFHGPGESHIELGCVPAVPESVVPVWSDWV